MCLCSRFICKVSVLRNTSWNLNKEQSVSGLSSDPEHLSRRLSDVQELEFLKQVLPKSDFPGEGDTKSQSNNTLIGWITFLRQD